MMKIRNSRYFLAVFMFLLLLGVVPMSVLGVFTYLKSSEIVQDKVNEVNMQNLMQTQMRMEQTLKIIDNLVIQFANSPIVYSSIDQSLTPYDFQTVNELYSGLSKLQTYELGIDDIFMLNMNKNWLIYSGGLAKLNETLDMDQVRKYLAVNKTSFWIMGKNLLPNANDKNYISLVKKLPENSSNAAGMLIAEIPYRKISNLLLSNDMLGRVTILDGNSRVVADQDNSQLGKDLSRALYVQKMKSLGEDEGHFISKMGSKDVWITFRHSGYNGWNYIYAVSVADITRDSKSIGWITIIICAVMLLLTYFISLQGSQRIYSPVKNLYESIRGQLDKNEAEKVGDEFKFIRERIKTLISDSSEMGRAMHGQLEQLKEFFVIKLIQGNIKQEEINEKLKLYGFTGSWKWLCVLVLQIDTFEGTQFEEKDMELMMFAVNNAVSELVPAENTPRPVLIDQYQVTIIGSNHDSTEALKHYIYSIAEMIQKSIYGYLNLKVSIGISRPFSGYTETHTAYREGVEALKYRMGLNSESVLHIEDVLPEYHPISSFPKQSELELIDAIKLSDMGRANVLLTSCIKGIFSEKTTRFDYQMSLVRLLMDIVRAAQELDDSFHLGQSEGKSVFDQLFSLKTEQEIENWFRDKVMAPVIHSLEKRRRIQYKDISQKVLDMIHNEYESDLTLASCAYRLNYHPNHISRVFRNETGLSFRDYLNHYRLKTAKKWLAETDMTVGEIAERLKYNNSQNFIRYFKKLEGITPGQYSESCRRRP